MHNIVRFWSDFFRWLWSTGEVWLLVTVGIVGAALIGLLTGCAHKPAAPDVVTLPEREGSAVAELLLELTGVRPDAVSLPGLPTIVFTPAGGDPCVLAHERAHREQQEREGPLLWAGRYAAEFVACMAPLPVEERRAATFGCYEGIGAEVAARAVEDACRGGK